MLFGRIGRRKKLSDSSILNEQEENTLEKKTVWVLGSPRSGSSWLVERMLNLPTYNVIWNEPHIGSTLASRREAEGKRDPYFFSENHEKNWIPPLRKLILARTYSHAKTISKNVIIKEPNGSMGADLVMKCLPNSKFIWLLRDGRDVVDSFIDLHKEDSWNPEFKPITKDYRSTVIINHAKSWQKNTEIVERAFQTHNSKLRLLIKYEDLRNNTFNHFKKILQFLNISKTDEEIQKIIEKYDFENIPKEQKGPGKFNRSAKVGGWKLNFSNDEQHLLNNTIGSTLLKLGYEV